MAIDYTALAIPKPEPWKRVKGRRKRVKAAARKTCRAARYAKDSGCCVDCGRHLKLLPSEARHEFEIAHIHEIKPRSLGGSAVDVANTETRCYRCHGKAHRQ